AQRLRGERAKRDRERRRSGKTNFLFPYRRKYGKMSVGNPPACACGQSLRTGGWAGRGCVYGSSRRPLGACGTQGVGEALWFVSLWKTAASSTSSSIKRPPPSPAKILKN